jgi:hypothetical protein
MYSFQATFDFISPSIKKSQDEQDGGKTCSGDLPPLFRYPLNITTALLQDLETHTKEQELKMGGGCRDTSVMN